MAVDTGERAYRRPVGRATPPLGTLVAFWAWLAGVLAAPLLILGGGDSAVPHDRDYEHLALILLAYSGTHLAVLIGKGEPRLMAGIFWLFVYISFGIVPLAQIATGLHSYLMAETLLPKAAGLILAGCVAYDFGTWLGNRRKAEDRPYQVLSRNRLRAVSYFAVIASAYYIHSIDISAFFTSRQALTTGFGVTDASTHVGVALVQSFGSVPALICLAGWIVMIARGDRSGAAAGWVVIFAGINLIVNNPISNARYWFLTVALGLVFCLPKARGWVFRWALIGGAIAALLIFPHSDRYRLTQNGAASQSLAGLSVTQTLSSKDYDQMTMTANGIWWIQEERGGAHTWGGQLLGDALFFVPRSQWASKAHDTGVDIGTAMQVRNVNLSSPLWIELWVDFALPGMLLLMALFGRISARLDRRFIAGAGPERRQTHILDVGLPILAGYEFIILRGPLLQAMGKLAVIGLVLWYLKVRERPRQNMTKYSTP